MRWMSVLIAALFCVGLVWADDKPTTLPTSQPADVARAAYDAADEQANADFKGAVVIAAKDYTAELATAFKTAMDAVKLDDANRLKAEMDRVSQGNDVSAAAAKGPAMIAVRQKYDKAVEKAQGQRLRANDGAKRQYIRDLQSAIAVAMKSGKLEEANRLNGIVDGLQPRTVAKAPKAADPPTRQTAPLKKNVADAGKPQLVNLLALADLHKDVVRGKWVRTQDGLFDDNNFWAVLRTPYVPPDEYDYGIDFTVRYTADISEISLLVPHDGKAGEIKFPNRIERTLTMTGCDMNGGVTTKGPFFEKGKRYRIVAKVRKDKVSVYLNDKLVGEGAQDKDKPSDVWDIFYAGETTLGLASIYTAVEFHSASVQEISGRGTVATLPALGDVPSIDGAVPNDKPKRTVNLLSLVDARKDVVNGTWVWVDKALFSKDGKDVCRVRLPYQPPEEYDLRVTFARVSGRPSDVGLILNDGDAEFTYHMGISENTRCGLMLINNRGAWENGTAVRAPMIIANDRKYTVVAYVRKKYVAISIDGKLVAKYETDGSDLSCHTAWTIGGKRLGIGSSWSPTMFYSIDVAEITGEGRIDKR